MVIIERCQRLDTGSIPVIRSKTCLCRSFGKDSALSMRKSGFDSRHRRQLYAVVVKLDITELYESSDRGSSPRDRANTVFGL